MYFYGLQQLAVATAADCYALNIITGMLYTTFIISLYEQFENSYMYLLTKLKFYVDIHHLLYLLFF